MRCTAAHRIGVQSFNQTADRSYETAVGTSCVAHQRSATGARRLVAFSTTAHDPVAPAGALRHASIGAAVQSRGCLATTGDWTPMSRLAARIRTNRRMDYGRS